MAVSAWRRQERRGSDRLVQARQARSGLARLVFEGMGALRHGTSSKGRHGADGQGKVGTGAAMQARNGAASQRRARTGQEQKGTAGMVGIVFDRRSWGLNGTAGGDRNCSAPIGNGRQRSDGKAGLAGVGQARSGRARLWMDRYGRLGPEGKGLDRSVTSLRRKAGWARLDQDRPGIGRIGEARPAQ